MKLLLQFTMVLRMTPANIVMQSNMSEILQQNKNKQVKNTRINDPILLINFNSSYDVSKSLS